MLAWKKEYRTESKEWEETVPFHVEQGPILGQAQAEGTNVRFLCMLRYYNWMELLVGLLVVKRI